MGGRLRFRNIKNGFELAGHWDWGVGDVPERSERFRMLLLMRQNGGRGPRVIVQGYHSIVR